MRVLFLSNFYPPHELGGYEQLCHEVAVRLQERGYSIQVLTSRYAPVDVGASGFSSKDVVRVLELQSDIYHYSPADFILKRARQEKANLDHLREVLNQFRPDVLLVWGMWNLSHTLPYWAEQWLPNRVGYYIASYWPLDEDPHTAYWKLPARRRLAEWVKVPLRKLALSHLRQEEYPPRLQLKFVASVSQYVRGTLEKAGKIPCGTRILYNGIDPEPFLRRISVLEQENRPEPLRLLYFGRLIADKGVHTAIEALGLLHRRGLADQIELTIIGAGHPEYEQRLHDLVAQFDLARQVRFVGQLPRREVAQMLKSFDIYLFTSIWPEPMARSVMEAMAAGLLVIGSEVGGQVEMLDNGRNALTFRSEDAAELAAQIARAAGDPLLRHRLAQEGQQTILEKFTLDRMVDEVEDFLCSIAHEQVLE